MPAKNSINSFTADHANWNLQLWQKSDGVLVAFKAVRIICQRFSKQKWSAVIFYSRHYAKVKQILGKIQKVAYFVWACSISSANTLTTSTTGSSLLLYFQPLLLWYTARLVANVHLQKHCNGSNMLQTPVWHSSNFIFKPLCVCTMLYI